MISQPHATEAKSPRSEVCNQSSPLCDSKRVIPVCTWHSVDQIRKKNDEHNLRPGLFSLIDVFEQETRKHGSFAFLGRHSDNSSAT